MKDRKKCFCRFSIYEQEAIERNLESMAAAGWMIEKAGSYIWTYKKAEPRRMRFTVTYFPDSIEKAALLLKPAK